MAPFGREGRELKGNMSKSRTQNWAILIALAVGCLLAVMGGLWMFLSATTKRLHPNPAEVPSATRSAPLPNWADAVAQGRQIVRAGISERNLPGLSVAVGVGGDIVWAEGFGWADLEKRVPVTPEMKFRIGTASIALTSAAVGLLLEQKRLKLDEEIQTYVPEFPKKQWPVTLRQLMGHVAGLSTDTDDEGPYGERCEQTVEGIKLFKDQTLLFEPGTKYSFSSFGWILVSAAVEAAAGEPFFAYMQKQIFEPLGMNDTMADSIDPIPNRATFYFPRFAADPRYGLHFALPINYSCYTGSSAFLSTPSDLARFGMAINGGKLLQPATLELLQTSHRLLSGEETGYGLGWDLETVALAGKQTRVVGHDGNSIGGMVASFMMFREQGIVVAVTANISHADTFSIAVKIAQAFANQGRSPAGK